MNRYDEKMRELGGQFYGTRRGEPPITLTEEDLAEVERELRNSLPTDYREFLRDYGGYDVFPCFRFPLKNATDGETEGLASHFMAVWKPPYRMPGSTNLLLNYKDMRESEWELSAFPGLTMLRPVADRLRFIERTMDFNGFKTTRLADPDSGWFEGGDELYLPWPPELLPIGSNPGHTDICLSIDRDYRGAVFYLQNIPNSTQNFYLVADSFDEFMQSATLFT